MLYVSDTPVKKYLEIVEKKFLESMMYLYLAGSNSAFQLNSQMFLFHFFFLK